MQTTAYNGWTNYATWRINLEIIDGMEFDYEVTSESIQDLVEDLITQDCNNDLTTSYALAFTKEVNWNEITESINNNKREELLYQFNNMSQLPIFEISYSNYNIESEYDYEIYNIIANDKGLSILDTNIQVEWELGYDLDYHLENLYSLCIDDLLSK